MKKVFIIVFAIVLMSFIGCRNSRIQSPEGKTLMLGHKSSDVAAQYEARTYYVVWGIVPLNDHTSDVITSSFNDGDVIVAETQVTFIDWLIGIPGGYVTLVSNTKTIEKIK